MKYGILFALLVGISHSAYADEDRPSWFKKDVKTPSDWTFYCEAEGKTEDEALASAKSQCTLRMCALFGLEVDAQTTTTEDLKNTSVTSTVVERCPKVRLDGREEKRKNVSCVDQSCHAYLMQRYPVSAFEKEKLRLAGGGSAEGPKEKFKDPEECRKKLAAFPPLTTESTKAAAERVRILDAARVACSNLDFRDNDLQEELKGYLIRNFTKRSPTAAMALNEIYQREAKLPKKIEAFLVYEKGRAGSGELRARMEKRLQEDFDWLFARDNYVAEQGGFYDARGERHKESPYLVEMRACRHLSQLLYEWPHDLGDDINVCVPPVKGVGQAPDCRSTSLLMLRAQFAGCLCHQHAAKDEQGCARNLFSELQNRCATESGSPCVVAAVRAMKMRVPE